MTTTSTLHVEPEIADVNLGMESPAIEDVTRRELFEATFGAALLAALGQAGLLDTPVAEADGAFPVTIDHKFGSTTIPAEPKRIVSVDVADHDFLLTLGVTPVGVRDWYGDQPYATWPWAQAALGAGQPAILKGDEINFEQVAALAPDLIVGVRGYLKPAEYRVLSAIAPTIAQPAEHDGTITPWQDATMILGRATGREVIAADIVAGLDRRIVEIRAAHPEWQGRTAVFVNHHPQNPHAYASADNRSKLLLDLGFVIPPEIDRIANGTHFAYFSKENLSVIDADLLIWYVWDDDVRPIQALTLRPFLRAVREGREMVAGELLGGAWAHATPLSLGYVLDAIVSEIEAALDGNPATPVPSAVSYGLVGPF